MADKGSRAGGWRRRASTTLARVAHPFWSNGKLGKVAQVLGLRAAYRLVQRRLFPPQVLDLKIRGEKLRFWFPQAEAPYDYDDGGENDTIVPLDRMLKPGATLLDVGANIGYVAVYCARRVGPGGLVLAFEPDPTHRTYLRRNLELNGVSNVKVVEAAAGATETRVTFHHDRVTGSGVGLEIPVTTLDAAVAAYSIGRVDAIKIDVEGYELEVLQGANAVLKARPPILLELHPQFLSERGLDPAAPLDLLRERGYALYAMERESGRFGLVPLDPKAITHMQVVALAAPEGGKESGQPSQAI